MLEDPEMKERLQEQERKIREHRGEPADKHDAPGEPDAPRDVQPSDLPQDVGLQSDVGPPDAEHGNTVPPNGGGEDEDFGPELPADFWNRGSDSRGYIRDRTDDENTDQQMLKRARLEDSLNLVAKDERRTSVEGGIHQYDVCELFSVPRVNKFAQQHGLRPGWSVDLTCADPITNRCWDFRDPKDRKQLIQRIRREKPLVIIGSPPHKLFCELKTLRVNRDSAKYESLKRDAIQLMEFACEVYAIQIAGGRYFVHKHPSLATSWSLDCVKKILDRSDVGTVRVDMCMYGLNFQDASGIGATYNPTRLMSNLDTVLNSINRRCDQTHRHAQLPNGRAEPCARYSPEFCAELLKSIQIGLYADLEANRLSVMSVLDEQPTEDYYVDDVSGVKLDAKKVNEARKSEIDEMHERGVYEPISLEEAKRRGMLKTISTRWVDRDKGTPGAPNYRSRLVAREIAYQPRDDIFAPTPSLEAIKVLLAILATTPKRNYRLGILDVSKAFLYAAIRDNLFIKIPAEDDKCGSYKIGHLKKSMYGTRDAPRAWHQHVRDFLEGLGFTCGKSNPCLFTHRSMDLRVVVHVDDFAYVGSRGAIDWFVREVSEAYKVNAAVLGPGQDEQSEVTYLNRLIRWTKDGIEYEPDPKHATEIVTMLGLGGARTVGTPGTVEDDVGHVQQEMVEHLTGEDATRYRQIVAKCNYLAQDRADIAYATKCVAQHMANPRSVDWKPLKRLGRYLHANPVVVQKFRWGSWPDKICGYTDADWGGCRTTRRSTSGGALKIGDYMVKSWSKTQHCIALSSAESELYALVRCACESLGLQSLLRDWDIELPVHVMTDASATRAMVMRQGLGRTKHVDVQSLWVQEQVSRGSMCINKIIRDKNPSDLMTHHWTAAEGSKHLPRLGLYRR